MEKSRYNPICRVAAAVIALAVYFSPLVSLAQTRVTVPGNRYSVSDDIKLGRQAAAEVERQMPTLPEGGEADDYVESVGRRLVSAVPAEFRRPQFNYEFDVINARDINAFALPGGYMYVNRGMIEAARSEGEMAGVMAHELAHVVLRHGTAQASEAQSLKFQLPAIGGAILGAIIGGGLGSVIAQGTQFGLGAYFLKYSRNYERQADLLGSQIMARAGYDPRDLANMFRTIERQGGGRGGPEWLSSHPNPGNRYEAINREAQVLNVRNPIRNTPEFSRVRARLRDMPAARSMGEVSRGGGRGGSSSPPRGRVEYPSSRYRAFRGNIYEISVPENWREVGGGGAATYVPEGGYGDIQGRFVFTHGVQVGVARAESSDLRRATDALIQGFQQGNPQLRRQSNYERGSIDRQEALGVKLSNVSEVTRGEEVVVMYTTLLRNGDLFYMIAVAPEEEYYRAYERTFQNVLRSIRLNG